MLNPRAALAVIDTHSGPDRPDVDARVSALEAEVRELAVLNRSLLGTLYRVLGQDT